MEYRSHDKAPVSKDARTHRRRAERKKSNDAQEHNRQRSRSGSGEPNELGVIQGQNGEQGNTVDPNQAKDIGRTSQP